MDQALDLGIVDAWCDVDVEQLQQLVQRMRAIRRADARLARAIEELSWDAPRGALTPAQTTSEVRQGSP